ncbi:hypothetical protein C1H46_004344 [Malus baccata]|uniref:Uncharacterized protein n=1 Tax=Malus baccata TaxID=106549 RepID=A0A540NG86_MALBA|nr:hypothetical protein C1H46_004344 [Malus baccata]
MDTDDFSFPTHNFPLTPIDSPPLWCLSPAAEEDRNHGEDIMDAVNCSYQRRKSVSHIERGGRKMREKEEEETKTMDMLWEDFNEELPMSRTAARSDYSGRFSQEILKQLGCVQSFKFSKTNSTTTTAVGVAGIMKVIKRLFFLHNPNHKLKKPAWR